MSMSHDYKYIMTYKYYLDILKIISARKIKNVIKSDTDIL